MKAWVTKYALTSGIREVEGIQDEEILVVRKTVDSYGDECFHGSEWHTTRETALARAEKMRLKHIESLKDSIAKMEKLSFK
jgi:hypothetical protein